MFENQQPKLGSVSTLSVYLCPLKNFPIVKLQRQNANRVNLDRTTPEFAFQVAITPKLPASPFAVACHNHRVMAYLRDTKKKADPNVKVGSYQNNLKSESIIKCTVRMTTYLLRKEPETFVRVISFISLSKQWVERLACTTLR